MSSSNTARPVHIRFAEEDVNDFNCQCTNKVYPFMYVFVTSIALHAGDGIMNASISSALEVVDRIMNAGG